MSMLDSSVLSFNKTTLQSLADNLTLNSTDINENLVKSFRPVILYGNYFLLSTSLVIVVCDILTAQALGRCKRIPLHCKHLCVSLVLSDASSSALFILHQLAIFTFDGFGIDFDILHTSRIGTVAIFHLIASANIVLLTLERVLALKANLKYSAVLRKINIKVVIFCLWLIHMLVYGCILGVSVYTHCFSTSDYCDIWQVSSAQRYSLAITAILYDILLIIGNIVVLRVALQHVRRIHALNRSVFTKVDSITRDQQNTLVSIAKLLTAYLILHAPLTVCFFINSQYDDLRDLSWMQGFRSVGYLCYQIDSFISIYLYIVTFQECKMYLYLILAKGFKRFERKAELLRLKVYDIVVVGAKETIKT